MPQDIGGISNLKVTVKSIADLKFIWLYIYTGLLIFVSIEAHAQNQASQLWLDFTQDAKLKNGYSFDNQFSYRTILDNADKWRSFRTRPEIEKSLTGRLDVMAYLNLIYTQQQEDYNTFEIRPGLGVRYHIDPLKKLTLRLLARLEFRNQYTAHIDSWDQSFRTRFRFEQSYLISGKSFSENHFWYAIADQEIFSQLAKDVEERYSDELVLRLGLGWKQNSRWRYECIYAYELSKNTIDAEFGHQTGGIIRLRGRYYFK
jgi:hypothetical protein